MKIGKIPRILMPPEQSFFLFGPRGTGKSTWLRDRLPDAIFVDLLDYSLFMKLSADPHALEALIGQRPEGTWVVLDEIQKIPLLLDEVHRLMESRKWHFALSGSSARKLRRGGVNLLAGRAVTRHLGAFSASELGAAFNLELALEWGSLPVVAANYETAADTLNAYLNTYIREEIREEALLRREPPFLRFLGIAGLLNGQMVNAQGIARDASVPRSSVDSYFSILTDTLVGCFLPAYRPVLKVREQTHPKFYWFDSGLARAAAGLLFDPVERLWKGTALETLIYQEMRIFNEVRQKHRLISYYRTAAGVEIDFVVETRKRQESNPPHVVCIEVKMAEKWDRGWEKPARSLSADSRIVVDRMIGVYRGERAWHYDGFDVLPVCDFLRQLHDGSVF